MKPVFLLIHGFGFDRHFWGALIAAWPEAEFRAWDLGFFGPPHQPSLPPNRKVVAVGHSYGGLWLLKHRPCRWDALVLINGFTRFGQASDFPQGVPQTQIEAMQADLAQDAEDLIGRFRRTCGDSAALPGETDRAVLREALADLSMADFRDQGADLALCGRRDRVVPAAMSRALFPDHAIVWHAGGHLLPQQDPAWCAAQLRARFGEAA